MNAQRSKERLIVGITGASGVIYGIRLMEVLAELGTHETHLVISPSAERTLGLETDTTTEQLRALADVVHHYRDIASPISSGSFRTLGMAVVPCSIKSLSGIVNSYNDNMIARAADVVLKERRKLVVVFRETPLHKGHLEMMLRLVEYGGILLPPMPAFYHQPTSMMELIDQTVGKVLDQFGVEHDLFRRWSGPEKTRRPQPVTRAAGDDS